jgi:hypothetical protein
MRRIPQAAATEKLIRETRRNREISLEVLDQTPKSLEGSRVARRLLVSLRLKSKAIFTSEERGTIRRPRHNAQT